MVRAHCSPAGRSRSSPARAQPQAQAPAIRMKTRTIRTSQIASNKEARPVVAPLFLRRGMMGNDQQQPDSSGYFAEVRTEGEPVRVFSAALRRAWPLR